MRKLKKKFEMKPIIMIDLLLVVLLFVGVFVSARIFSKDAIVKKEAVRNAQEQAKLEELETKQQDQEQKVDAKQDQENTEQDQTEQDQTVTKEDGVQESLVPQITSKETEKSAISILFGGDILLTEDILNNYDSEGISGIISPGLQEVTKEAQLFVANIDFPFCDSDEKDDKKEYTFKAERSRVEVLKELGIGLVNTANTHTLDYGETGLAESMAALDEAGILHMGSGSNIEEAKAFTTVELGGFKIGFIGLADILPEESWAATTQSGGVFAVKDEEVVKQQIINAKKTCDKIVIYLNWGTEKALAPDVSQKELAKQFIDAGANMVLGSHSHTLQGIEYYKDKPIVYSLGDFLFNSNVYETMLLKMNMDETGSISLSVVPCKAGEGRIWVVDEPQSIYNMISERSSGVYVDAEGTIVAGENPNPTTDANNATDTTDSTEEVEE